MQLDWLVFDLVHALMCEAPGDGDGFIIVPTDERAGQMAGHLELWLKQRGMEWEGCEIEGGSYYWVGKDYESLTIASQGKAKRPTWVPEAWIEVL